MKFLVLAALLAVAAADSAYPAYPAPAAYSAPAYNHKSYDYPAHPYNFAYAVKDDYTYNNYGHQESSDGKIVSGSYQVLLPDGRTQTVNYKVDGYSGYVADVKYNGEAKAYDYKPAYKAAYTAPAYTAPAYTAPAYTAPAYTAPVYTAPAPAYKADY